MNIRNLNRSARSAMATGLTLTASTIALAAVAMAEPATGGRFELAQRGPDAGQQAPDDQQDNRRKGKREGRQDGHSDQGDRGERSRGERGLKARGGDGDTPDRGRGDRGQRARGGDGDMPDRGRGPRARDAQSGPQGGRGPRDSNGGDAGPPGGERNQRSRNAQPQPQIQQQAPLQQQPVQRQAPQAIQPSTRSAPLVNEQDGQRGGSRERRFRKDQDRPATAPPADARQLRRDADSPPALAPTQRPAGAVDMAPSRMQKPVDMTPDRRDRGGRDFSGRRNGNADTNRDYKRWRSERRQEERSGGFANIDALKQKRTERRLQGGGMIIEEPDARRIIRSGDRSFITRDETRRMRRYGEVTDYRRRPGGGNITTIVRPDGVRVITETSPDGRLIRRYRRTRDGRDIILVDNRRTWRKWGAIGAGAVLATGLVLALDPPHYRMPRERYIIEYDHASYDDVYDALRAPPIDNIGRGYTLDQVLFNYNLRERMRRIDLDSINFDTGSWDIDDRQFDKLETLARAIDRILDRNPDEVFLIEGHTDAVGDPVSNRSLSDRRAEEVANVLTEEFRVPPENLVIQGYGEEFLKVPTDGPSRANRRVTVRRITPLLDRRNTSYRDDR